MQWSSCYPYTRTNVRMWTPPQPGLYCLLTNNRIFYIGQSKNLQNRLLEHLGPRESNRPLKHYLKAGVCLFQFAGLASEEDLLQTERDEILKYKPPCNIAEHPPVVGRWRKWEQALTDRIRIRLGCMSRL